jgi:dipeptidase D
MKTKISICIIIAVLLASSFTLSGCGSTFDQATSNKLEKDVHRLYKDFKPIYATADSEREITNYLYKWAKKYHLAAKKLTGGNVLITKSASESASKIPYTILQCAVTRKNTTDASQRAAIALATLLNLKENGKVSVLFTANQSGEFNGAKQLSLKNLDSDYFIHMESDTVSAVNTGSAGTSEYAMSMTYKMAKPTTTTAYQISIKGLPGSDSSNLTGSNPNPIINIADFLIGCRASGMLVELADFDGGISPGNYPGSARALIMVNQNSEEKLLARFTSASESFTKKYGSDFPDASFTLTKVSSPKAIINNDNAAKILSLLYTTINGVYKSSNENSGGTTLAVANIGKLSTAANKMTVRILARSVEDSILKEMNDSYHATAYLSDATFKIVKQSPVWTFDSQQKFSQDFVNIAKNAGLNLDSASPTFLQSECAVFYQMKKDINMISFSVTNKDAFSDAKTLYLFVTGLAHKTT